MMQQWPPSCLAGWLPRHAPTAPRSPARGQKRPCITLRDANNGLNTSILDFADSPSPASPYAPALDQAPACAIRAHATFAEALG
ncbi:MAG: hypothetical protein COW59_04335 [Lysobacterales bacterium CG17_big_fil_post_rev_8_21_14_2_50_64_11]|nr:MAG: hypothetical protein COW59_04335 [Xanthomonadales bacterium CG17_big_fil_post_rev_8_21_14_2_50_64_11]PIX61686.1 MAG: hypothetical protein COZ47_00630 [Xanthomonadales bacterium CG_4_10_14_3_um_filter_64_11]